MSDLVDVELARQKASLVGLGYPALAGLSEQEFDALVDPLRAVVPVPGTAWSGAPPATVPWLLVVGPSLVAAEQLVPLLRLPASDRPGVVDRNHGDDPLSAYVPTAELDVPKEPVYVVVDVERGDEFCGVRPRDAVPTILGRGRTPLTIHEGLALATQFPESLEKNRCFMLAGSRRGDKRVPALWISNRAPKLGWCWEGNLHTWLGIASAGRRSGPAEPPYEGTVLCG